MSNLFSRIKKKNIIKLSSTDFTESVLTITPFLFLLENREAKEHPIKHSRHKTASEFVGAFYQAWETVQFHLKILTALWQRHRTAHLLLCPS